MTPNLPHVGVGPVMARSPRAMYVAGVAGVAFLIIIVIRNESLVRRCLPDLGTEIKFSK